MAVVVQIPWLAPKSANTLTHRCYKYIFVENWFRDIRKSVHFYKYMGPSYISVSWKCMRFLQRCMNRFVSNITHSCICSAFVYFTVYIGIAQLAQF